MSNRGEDTDFNFTRYHDKTCLDRHPNLLSEDNTRWVAQQDRDVDSVVRIERIRKENPDLTLAIAEAVRDDQHRAVLMALAQGAGAETYDGIEPFMRCSRRTLKRRVRELEDMDIVTVDNSKPAVISYPSEPIELLVEDTLSMFF